MALIISSPHAELHPAHVYQGRSGAGLFWSSVEHDLLADRLARPEDREQVRSTQDPGQARALAATLPHRPGWRDELPAVLRRTLLRVFASQHAMRAALLSTGSQQLDARTDEPLYDEENLLGILLMEVRAELRARLQDPEAVHCEHRDAESFERVCLHLLSEAPVVPRPRHRRFTGRAGEYELICEACAAALPAPPPMRRVCATCFLETRWGTGGLDIGLPEFRERAGEVQLEHTTVRVPGLLLGELHALVPVPRGPRTWLALERRGQLHRLVLPEGRREPLARVPEDAVDLGTQVGLQVAPGGELVAITETYGRRAVVLDPRTGEERLRITRDEYYAEMTPFPLAFFEHAGALRLVYATEWNRLDVFDPFTGALLTPRDETAYVGDQRPAHHLDYFHGTLVPSPSGELLLSNGWVWGSTGRLRAFSLRRWLEEYRWESEDGPSVHVLCDREADIPICWLGEPRAVIWGEEEDEGRGHSPMVRIVDVRTGLELGRFRGPHEHLLHDPPYLVAYGAAGAGVWDLATGERLAFDPSLRPIGHHPASRELVTPVGIDELRVTRRR